MDVEMRGRMYALELPATQLQRFPAKPNRGDSTA
jgi:hypothetical protein